MKKLSEKETKKIVGGTTYKCKYCSFTTTTKKKMSLHYLNIHNVTWP